MTRARIAFWGHVTDGIGRFSAEMVIPGAGRVSARIRDWPEKLEPGTFNLLVQEFPPEFQARIGGDLKALDRRVFLPETELSWVEIERNTLRPTPALPDRGNAQIWRAMLSAERTGREAQCWVLRRIGSGYHNKFECVAAVRLRDELAVVNGDRVRLEVEGRWASESNPV